jgi:isopentenyl-diphosphate delta-isomerase
MTSPIPHTYITGSKQVQLVTTKGETNNSEDIFVAHTHPAQLHRACSVWLINNSGQVLLQQRSSLKILGALWWGNTVCGNVKPDETALECAYRRLKEELGIISTATHPVKLTELYTFTYKAYCNETFGEYEYDHVFVGQYDGPTNLNPDEVAQTAWVDAASLRSAALAHPYPTAAETVAMSPAELQTTTGVANLQLPETIGHQLGENPASFCPWTVMMLRDDQLQLSVK